ncbi:MAG: acyl-CoA dehydrogenase family protein [Gammaproteobacteria bacterium]|nr:acyl-CoA dehydrogenase family protein [Gammaproteobacteria bacterium]
MSLEHISYAWDKNHWTLDPDLPVVLRHFWPGWAEAQADLEHYGKLAGREVYETCYHVDHEAPPVLVQYDVDGRRVDRVRLAPAERDLLRELAPVMRPPYEGGSWHHHYALGYLIADPGLFCVLTITQQTVYAIHKYAPEHAEWKEKILAGEAFGATWMTENQGGSDLGANRARAVNENGTWRIYDGDKYFASGAGLTDVAITTARPEGAPDGPKGLALFLLPRLDAKGELNFRVRRLKDKTATRAVPSGEVELDGAEAWLIGKAEEGIYYALENLTVSRLTNATAAMGIARKAAFEVAGRVTHRRSFGKPLIEHPLVRRDLTDMAVRLAGGTALAFRAVADFDRVWKEPPPFGEAYHAARFWSHLAKVRTADHAAAVTQMAMELFGGLGFLGEYAVERWHREALITPIWEGPANIQSLDMLEAMAKKHAHEPFVAEVSGLLERAATDEAELARKLLDETLAAQAAAADRSEAEWLAKRTLTRLADIASVALLYDLAGTGGERYARLAGLYARRFLADEEYPAWVASESDLFRLVADQAGGNDGF